MKIIFDNPVWWNLLWVVGLLAIVVAVGVSWRRRALLRFTGKRFAGLLAPQVSIGKLRVKAILFILAMVGLVFAIVDIRWGRRWVDVPQKGVDVMFLLDVSKSMLAEDVKPTRMNRAEQYIRDMMDVMDGDRVGLITFAGNCKMVVPMTSNYTEVSMALREIGPDSVTRGGTNIGDAIREASRRFLDKTPDNKAIVIFTDGEDHESYPVEAATVAFKKKGIKVFIVAMGDVKTGSRIPVASMRQGKVYMLHDGKEVWSKMDKGLLEKIAIAGGGAMIPLGTKQADMADVYNSFIDPIEDRQFDQARVNTYTPRFQWFLLPAVLLLLIESMILGRRKKNGKHINAAVLLLGAIILFNGGDAMADVSPQEAVKQANKALDEGKYNQALRVYDSLNVDPADQHRLNYNKGVAQYRKGDIQKAQELLKIAGEQGSKELEANARFNIANCYYNQAMKAGKAKKFDEAMKLLDEATSQYRQALAINPNDTDARANVELADLYRRELKKQKQQQQKQDKKDNKKNKQDQQNKDEQQKSDSQKKQDQDKNKQEQQNKNDQQKSEDQKKDNKQDNKDNQNQPQDKQGEKNKPKDSDENKPKEKPEDKKADENKDKQDQQAGEDKKQKGKKSAQKPQPKPAKLQPKKLSKEEAARLLQGVRDRDFKRRQKKAMKARTINFPVNKDW